MSDKTKMTPGPWQAGYDPYAHHWEVRTADYHTTAVGGPTAKIPVVHLQNESNARAIACLPELIEAARGVLAVEEKDAPNYIRAQFAELRRILARIDGGDNGL